MVTIEENKQFWRATLTPVGHYFLFYQKYPPGFAELEPSPQAYPRASAEPTDEIEPTVDEEWVEYGSTPPPVVQPAIDSLREALARPTIRNRTRTHLDANWYAAPHQSHPEDAIPDHLSRGSGYARQPGEYVRPSNKCILGGSYERYGAGVYFEQKKLLTLTGKVLYCELVPEPGNWFDCEAVAVDYEGERIGYVPANDANCWHEIVRRVNARGLRFMVPATLEEWIDGDDGDDGDDEFSYVGISIYLPNYDERSLLADELGIVTEFRVLFNALSSDLRESMGSRGLDGYGVSAALIEHQHLMPSLPWGKGGWYAKYGQIPAIVAEMVDVMRDEWWEENSERICVERKIEAAQHQIQFDIDVDHLVAVRMSLHKQLLELHECGASVREIEGCTKLPTNRVEALLAEAIRLSDARCSGAHCVDVLDQFDIPRTVERSDLPSVTYLIPAALTPKPVPSPGHVLPVPDYRRSYLYGISLRNQSLGHLNVGATATV
ncbi:hypothetical protein [Rhodococcus sp. ARC_M6]|uniref:hypothetical protein n=1 Tax=Rhodococcus sp. ARC_M6 TaxID=2928852 RepID=UPI001FB3FC9C|nr:hypothetical protein [Rhodococcus sp. ARC_M6]MCJ0907504.1 hypothetical protein [Rhodococcus sp. ARC_M6]